MATTNFLTAPTKEYVLGDMAHLYTPSPFLNDTNTATDPTTLMIYVWRHGEAATTYEYGTDPEVVREGVGEYHLDFQPSREGMWFYRWYPQGAVTGAYEGRFLVKSRYATSL